MDLTIIDEFLKLFMDAVVGAAGPIEDAAGDLLRSLIWVTVFWGAAQIVAGRVSDNAVVQFMGWFYRLWLICFIGANWLFILQTGMEGMIGLGAAAGGMSADDFMTVSRLMRTGYRILDPIWQHQQALCAGPWSCAMNFWEALKYEVAWYLVFFSFAYMCWQCIAAQVQFMYHGLATLFLLPTAAIPQLAWISERGIGGVIANGIYLMVLPLILGIGMAMFQAMHIRPDLSVNQATLSAVLSIFMALAVYKAKEIGDGIVNGGPSLSGNSLVSGVAAEIIAATGIGRLAMSGAAAANSFAKSGNRLLWGQASSSGGNSFAGTLAGGGSPFGRGGGNSAWDRPPTDRQQAAAKSRGISLSGMNRGQASQALERAGLGPSWFQDESSGGASLAPASVSPGTGPAGAARAGNPFSRAQTRMQCSGRTGSRRGERTWGRRSDRECRHGCTARQPSRSAIPCFGPIKRSGRWHRFIKRFRHAPLASGQRRTERRSQPGGAASALGSGAVRSRRSAWHPWGTALQLSGTVGA